MFNAIHKYQILANIHDGSKEKIEFFLKNSHKLSALSMAGKLLSFTLVFAFMPMGIVGSQTPKYKTDVKLDKNSPIILTIDKKPVVIESGEANVDRIGREQRLIESNNFVCAYEDPTDFRPIYQDAAKQFGIPWEILEAVHQVESGKSGSTTTRSYAGAQGPMQFMPGTWRAYKVDGNGDGLADANNVVDAIYGAAKLLASSGAADGDVDAALFNYNHAQWYVTKVKTIAYEIGYK